MAGKAHSTDGTAPFEGNKQAQRTAHDPGKPDGMAAECYFEQIQRLGQIRDALDDLDCVYRHGVALDDNAMICGHIVLPSERNFEPFNDLLGVHNLAIVHFVSRVYTRPHDDFSGPRRQPADRQERMVFASFEER